MEKAATHECFINVNVHIVIECLLGKLKRLLEYPHWLPIEICQISFYCERLERFQYYYFHRTPNINYHPGFSCIHDLISMILEYKNGKTSVDLPLTLVGEQLAREIAMIDSSITPKDPLMEYLESFPDYFYFDKSEYEGEVFVGFQEEVTRLLKQLASMTKKQLEVISIVGMAGLGKTTLATRLYNHPYVGSYFYVRAWVTCSQVYRKKDLMLAILRSVTQINDEFCGMNDNMLALVLYRALKGRRYLIVIDDIWSIEAWDDFKTSFPDDNNGSKIMLTTRLKDVALHAQSDGNPLCLRFLTEEESFDLFRRKAFITGSDLFRRKAFITGSDLSTRKVFITGSGFGNLNLIGRSITRKCRGLPLAVVVIAGLLKNNLERDWWADVERSVSSYVVNDVNQYMDTLALSYNHLPQHLRPCFLFFGAFPEDHDIPIRKLMWLWIAEGFIHQDDTKKSLEDVAKNYLRDLMNRSLVVASKKGPDGEIKTCRIHDLLRDLCLRKAKEDKFSPVIYKYNKHLYLSCHSLSDPSPKAQLLSINDVLVIPSNCSCNSSEVSQSFFQHVSNVWQTYTLIRALDISSIEFSVFPIQLLQLVHLRYLELQFRSGNLPESVSHLRELQTLIISPWMDVIVPKDTWKMINLRHLCIKSGENLVNFSNVEGESCLLENLQTMSLVSPTMPCQDILAKAHNLRKLGLCGPLKTKSGDLKCPDLGLLMHLETLKLLNTVSSCRRGRVSNSIIFPGSLKKLTMSNTRLDWREAWVFKIIPNLEILKLKLHAFVGKEWETSPEAFLRLKFLKLHISNIVTWRAHRNHFPVLQRLHVSRCRYLREIPEDFGNICTLEWIVLTECSTVAQSSAMHIQREQEYNGNDSLKILFGQMPS